MSCFSLGIIMVQHSRYTKTWLQTTKVKKLAWNVSQGGGIIYALLNSGVSPKESRTYFRESRTHEKYCKAYIISLGNFFLVNIIANISNMTSIHKSYFLYKYKCIWKLWISCVWDKYLYHTPYTLILPMSGPARKSLFQIAWHFILNIIQVKMSWLTLYILIIYLHYIFIFLVILVL